jgi:hypothetical protein
MLKKTTSSAVRRMGDRKITGYAYKIAKSMMPKISDTERAALNAGTGIFNYLIFFGYIYML